MSQHRNIGLIRYINMADKLPRGTSSNSRSFHLFILRRLQSKLILSYWWFVELPCWFKTGFCPKFCGIFHVLGEKNFTRGEIQPMWGQTEYQKNSPIRGWGGLSKMSKKMSKMSIIELSRLSQDLFDFSDLTWGHPLTQPSTHRYLQTKSNYIDKFKLY